MTAFDALRVSKTTTIAALAATTISMTAAPTTTSAAEPVTTCGQVLAAGGYLTADLDCSAYTAGPAVTLNGGTLDLGGFTLTGNSATQLPLEYPESSVRCTSSCEIVGPGTVANGAEAAISALQKLRMRDVNVVSDGIGESIGVSADAVLMTDCIVEGFPAGGIGAGRRAKIAASAIRQNGAEGILVHTGRVMLRESSVTDNGWGWFANGVQAKSAVVRFSEVSGNTEHGIYTGGSVKLLSSRVADNHRSGVRHATGASAAGKGPVLVDSEIVDNCVSPQPDQPCGDVYSCEQPVAVSLNCEVSTTCDSVYPSWAICSLD